MSVEEREDTTIYKVVVNQEEHRPGRPTANLR
jgi:hypothetical protein